MKKMLSYITFISITIVALVGTRIPFSYQSFFLIFYISFIVYFLSGMLVSLWQNWKILMWFLLLPKCAVDVMSVIKNDYNFPEIFPFMTILNVVAAFLGFWIVPKLKSKLMMSFLATGVVLYVCGAFVGIYFVYKKSNTYYDPRPIHEYNLVDLEGQPVTSEDLKGKVVVLDFWNFRCGKCFLLFSKIEQLHKGFASDADVVVFTVHVGDEPLEKVADHPRLRNFTFGKLHDPNRQLADALDVVGMPQTFLFDKDGKLVKRHIGYRLFDDGIFFTWDWKRSIRALQ